MSVPHFSDEGGRRPVSDTPAGSRVHAASRRRGAISPAAAVASLYSFMIVSRFAEMIPFAAALRPMVLLAVVMVALAFSLPQTRSFALFRPVEARALVALLGLIALSVPTSYWMGLSVGALVGFSKSLIFFFSVVYCIRTRGEFRLALLSFVAAVGSLALLAVVSGAGGRVLEQRTYDVNDLAFVMACGIPLAIMLIFRERGVLRWALPGVALLCILSVILTVSRGGFIALVVVGVVVLVKIPSRIPFLRTGFVLAGILVFTLLASPAYWNRISTIWGGAEPARTPGEAYNQGGFNTARWQIWKNGLTLIAQHPLLGVGAGAFTVAEGTLHKGGKWNAPHSSFIQITAELGLGGLGLFLFLLYRGLANCRRVIRATRRAPALAGEYWAAHGLEGALVGYIVAGSALSHAYSDILYFLLAMSIVLARLTASRVHARGGASGVAPRPAHSGSWWKRAS